VFEFCKDEGYKSVSVETATVMWEVMLADRCKFIKTWNQFIMQEQEQQGLKAINKDTWSMLLELVEQT